MKTCQKCKKDYPDTENFCTICGAKLTAKGAEKPHKDILNLNKKIDFLHSKITSEPTKDFSNDIVTMKNKMRDMERKIDSENISMKNSLKHVDKKTERMGRLKHMPKDEALSIVSEISSMEKKIDGIKQAFSHMQSGNVSDAMVNHIEERILESSGALLSKQQFMIDELKNKIKTIETRLEEDEKDVEEDIEKVKKMFTSSDISRFLNTIEENRKKLIDLEEMKVEFENMKQRSASFDAQEIKDNILAEFENINKELVETIEKKKTDIQRIEHETAQMREGVESLRNLEKKVGTISSEDINRDLEILKTKTHWLESQIEGLDIRPLHDRIQELETDLKRITSSSPLIVE